MVLRSWNRVLVLAAMWTLVGLLGLAWEKSPPHTAQWSAPVGWVVLVASLIAAVRSLRSCIAVGQSEIVARKVWSTVKVSRDDFLGLGVFYSVTFRTENCVGVRRRGRATVGVPSVAASAKLFGPESAATAGIEEKQRRVDAFLHNSPGPSRLA